LPERLHGSIETCRRALAILKGYVPARAFRWDGIDRGWI